MGIVHSKVLGGSNLYGSSDGRGIVDVGKGAYRYVLFWCIILYLYHYTSSTQSHIESVNHPINNFSLSVP